MKDFARYGVVQNVAISKIAFLNASKVSKSIHVNKKKDAVTSSTGAGAKFGVRKKLRARTWVKMTRTEKWSPKRSAIMNSTVS